MNNVRCVHEIDSFTDLHHVQFTKTFSENEIIVDHTFEEFATGDSTKETTVRRSTQKEELQFHDQTDLFLAFESIVELKKSSVLQGFHDFDFIQRFDSILFFGYWNKLCRQEMLRALLATFLHFTEFTSTRKGLGTEERRRETNLPRNSKSSYSSPIALFFFTVTSRGEKGGSMSRDER